MPPARENCFSAGIVVLSIAEREFMIAASAGRRIDEKNAETSRFPLENLELVAARIWELLKTEAPTALVCSAACGADLLILEAAGKLGIERHIVLPFERERFRATSVTDRPGDWGEMFDEICDEVKGDGNLTVLEGFEDENEAYSMTTTEILNKAESLHGGGEGKNLAVVTWEGNVKNEADETAAFAEQARARNFVVKEILTKPA
jgi:hypothetical protein